MGHLDEVIEGKNQTMLAELLHFYIESRAPRYKGTFYTVEDILYLGK